MITIALKPAFHKCAQPNFLLILRYFPMMLRVLLKATGASGVSGPKKKLYEIASFSKLFLNFVQTLRHPFEGNCSFQFCKYIYLYRKTCNLVRFVFFCSTCSTRPIYFVPLGTVVIRSTGCYSLFA